jgi:hypothetical protein
MIAAMASATVPDAQSRCRTIIGEAGWMQYCQLVSSSADKAADIGGLCRSRYRSVTSSSTSRRPGAGMCRSRCGLTGKMAEILRQSLVKADKPIACPAADVQQAKQPRGSSGIGCLLRH